MKIINPDILAEFRSQRRCEICGKAGSVEPHHVMRKGIGGGSTKDVRINLLGVCRDDHTRLHAGTLVIDGCLWDTERQLLEISARECEHVDDIVAVLNLIDMIPPRSSPGAIMMYVIDLPTESAMALAQRTIPKERLP